MSILQLSNYTDSVVLPRQIAQQAIDLDTEARESILQFKRELDEICMQFADLSGLED